MEKEKRNLLFAFVEAYEITQESGILFEKILEGFSFLLENQDKISPKDILKLEQSFVNYSNLLKEKYFNYGIYANYTVGGDILENNL